MKRFAVLVMSAIVSDANDLGNLGDLGGLMGMLGKQNGKKDAGPLRSCPKGKHAAPVPLGVRSEKISANGCGPAGLQVSEDFGLYLCCNRHDVCYQGCGVSFDFCESQFAKCMRNVCKQQEDASQIEPCNKQANSFTGMTKAFGSGIWQSSQETACNCFDTKEEAFEGTLKYLQSVYEAAGEEKDEAVLNEMLKKFSGKKRQKLIEAINVKYGKHFVEFQNIKEEL